jgi:hypothetical protein
MNPIKSTGISNEKFAPWLRRELLRAVKWGSIVFVAGLTIISGLSAASSAFADGWANFNYRLSSVALDQHPVALVRLFANRLRESEYGWHLMKPTAPFNVTAARAALKHDFPEVAGVFDDVPLVPRAAALRQADPTRFEQRVATYLRRYQHIESGRFTSLYGRDDLFSAPNANVKLGLFVTKIFGLPDAFFFVIGTIVTSGLAGVVLFGTVLALTAPPLWRSRRPARTWLKLFVWPTLASTLIWAAIMIMAGSAALFGGLTPNTSALALLATLPLLYVFAKLPLHLAESLIPAPRIWDGIDRRKPRTNMKPPGPPPKPGETIPPWGGA